MIGEHLPEEGRGESRLPPAKEREPAYMPKTSSKAPKAPASTQEPAWSIPSLREPRYSQSLERGLAILSCFTPKRPVLGIADIADELGMSRSTTHRYVITLVALGYLEQGASRKYRLGLRVTDWACRRSTPPACASTPSPTWRSCASGRPTRLASRCSTAPRSSTSTVPAASAAGRTRSTSMCARLAAARRRHRDGQAAARQPARADQRELIAR